MPRRTLTTSLAVLALTGSGSGALAAATSPAPKGAIAAARATAHREFRVDSKVKVTGSLRSQVGRSWSLVTGGYGRRRIWAAWVRRRPSGRYTVEIFRTRNFDPGSRPPCDIRPAFSEPAC
jgi:hypothetical protein